MNLKKIKFVIMSFFVVHFSLLSATPAATPEKGFLDLSGEHLEANDSYYLAGEWKLYWNRILAPNELDSNKTNFFVYARFPSVWSGQKAGNITLSAEGMATYQLSIKLPENIDQIGVKLPYFYGWGKVYFNNDVVYEGGEVNFERRTSSSLGSGFYVYYTPKANMLNITVQTASFNTPGGGTEQSMILSKADRMAQRQSLTLSYDFFIISAILFMALYHAVLYYMRPSDKSTLLFSIFCFLISVRTVGVGEGKIIHSMLGIGALTAWRLEIITYYLGVPVITAFVASLYPLETRRRFLTSTIIIGTIFSAITLFTPSKIFSYTLPPFQALNVLLVFIYTVFLIKAAINKREGSLTFLVGFSILAFLSVAEIIAITFKIDIPRASSIGLFIFIFFQAALLAGRFNAAFKKVEHNEKRIRKLNEDLKEQERVRTMFFHNTSHELRTPLHGILAFGKMIRKGTYGALPERAGQNIAKIEKLAESLMMQVNTILDLAKSRRGEMSLINSLMPLDELTEETSFIAEGLLLKNEKSTFSISHNWGITEKSSMVTDREKVITIVRNLLGNAFKFHAAGSPNHIKCHFEYTPNQQLQIIVSDTGIGIDSTHHQTIFEEFRQVEADHRRGYEGTGLGLPMVKGMVQLMQGSIRLESTLGKGTTIEVTLPCYNEAMVISPRIETRTKEENEQTSRLLDVSINMDHPPRDEIKSLTKIDSKNYKILIVDDNPVNCEVISDILTTEGYPFHIALGGREAMELLDKNSFDLVLLDIMMPDFSGEDVLNAMKKDDLLSQIPIIILTARASEEDRLLGLSIGADDYLAKPVIAEELLLRVNNILSRLKLAKADTEKKIIESSLVEAQLVYASLGGEDSDIPGIELSSFYQPAERAGGDWFGYSYDAKREILYLLIGDVSGHDILSALVTVASAGCFKGALSLIKVIGENRTMKECLELLATTLNEAVSDSGKHANKAMTVAIVAINLKTGEAGILNAGHTPILHVKKEGVSSHLIPSNPLGFERNTDASYNPITLSPGDGLFIYTDGLTNNTGPEGQKLSLRSVKKLLQHENSAAETKKLILENCTLLWKNHSRKDDSSFLYVRWKSK